MKVKNVTGRKIVLAHSKNLFVGQVTNVVFNEEIAELVRVKAVEVVEMDLKRFKEYKNSEEAVREVVKFGLDLEKRKVGGHFLQPFELGVESFIEYFFGEVDESDIHDAKQNNKGKEPGQEESKPAAA